jgi:hypothetical protein
MTKLRIALLTVSMIFASVEAFGQKLYPVQGPLTAQTPVPVYSAKLKRPMFSVGSHATSSGSITWTLANGEKVQGALMTKLVTASSPDTKTAGDTSSYPPQPNLAFAWDAVYGQGFYVANILGHNIWQKVLTGNRGTVLQVETHTRETYIPQDVSIGANDNTEGVAIDNKGNIYKLVY